MTDPANAAPTLYILGTRGIPASHGGFETFAERFALYLRDRGWRVTVYCQADHGPRGPAIDDWEGIRRVTFAAESGALGTMKFDWYCVRHAMGEQGIMLVLGYNTAVFSALLRLAGHAVLTNMDGIEWKRAKWPWHGRIWLYFNEWVGALTSTKLIADHPEIAKHLRRRRSGKDIVTIPYGADEISAAPVDYISALGLRPGKYFLSVGRIEPENNILPMINAFTRGDRQFDFICLGKLSPNTNQYHAEVLAAGTGRVKFPGAIYDAPTVSALRFHAAAYCHGHSVGGTNPSLVESLGAGSAIIAHDNPYNRWVAGEGQLYFRDELECQAAFDKIEGDSRLLELAKLGAMNRFREAFLWAPILSSYETLAINALGRQDIDYLHHDRQANTEAKS